MLMQRSHNEVIDMKDVHIKNTSQRESWLGWFFKVPRRMFPRIEEPANQGPDEGERIRNGCPAHPALYISIPAISRVAQMKVKKWRALLRRRDVFKSENTFVKEMSLKNQF